MLGAGSTRGRGREGLEVTYTLERACRGGLRAQGWCVGRVRGQSQRCQSHVRVICGVAKSVAGADQQKNQFCQVATKPPPSLLHHEPRHAYRNADHGDGSKRHRALAGRFSIGLQLRDDCGLLRLGLVLGSSLGTFLRQRFLQ